MRTFELDLKAPIHSTRIARIAEKRGVTLNAVVHNFFASKVAPYPKQRMCATCNVTLANRGKSKKKENEEK